MPTLLATHSVPAATEHADCPEPTDVIRPLLPVVGADVAAPLVTGGEIRYANLDYAASAPALQAVCDHLHQALPYYSSVHRGAGFTSQVSTRLYESARQAVGQGPRSHRRPPGLPPAY